MTEEKRLRLEEKYAGTKAAPGSKKKELNVLNKGNQRSAAMSASGKPKDLRKTVKRLLNYLSKEKALLILAFATVIINTVSTLTASYLLRPVMNKFIYYDPKDSDLTLRLRGLLGGLCVMAVIYAIAVFTQWLQSRIMLNVSQRALLKMREELFKKVSHLPVKYFDNNPAGDIMSRFTNDVDTVGEMLNTTLIQIISGSITIVGTIVLMLYTNVILGLITIIMTPILTFVSKGIIKHGRIYYKAQQKNLGMLNGFSEEMINGQKVIKVFNHEETAKEEFEYLNENLCEAQIKAQFASGIIGPITHQLCNIIYALTATVGGLLVVFKGFDIGGLTVSLNYTRQFNRPINDISTQMNTIFAALAGAERVFEVLDETEECETSENLEMNSITGEIELKHVYFGYVPGTPILKDISLTAHPGQKIAFVGSTGAGKTTVTNLLSRFYDKDSGDILIDGVPIEKIKRSFLRSNIAMVLQDTHLFTGTVMENIRYGRLDATDEEVVEAAKIACAHNFITHLEKGYETELTHDGANLSQGQRQLLNIARAAISKAPILILDEATSSVDTRTESFIERGMDAIMKDRTTFVIAHRLSTVRKANEICVLEKGVIVERGTHDELLNAGGRYADLYNEIVELD